MADTKGYGDSGTQKGGQQEGGGSPQRKEGQPSPERDEEQRGQQGSQGGQQGGTPKREPGYGDSGTQRDRGGFVDESEPRPGEKRASDASKFDEEDEEEEAG
ncbi:MAG: hypothetical protein ACREOG_05600 [Gemmatimonadaceae bacterium]